MDVPVDIMLVQNPNFINNEEAPVGFVVTTFSCQSHAFRSSGTRQAPAQFR